MIKTDFLYRINDNETILVRAKANRVTPLEVYGLRLDFENEDGDEVDFYPDRYTMDEIEEMAMEFLNEKQENSELEF